MGVTKHPQNVAVICGDATERTFEMGSPAADDSRHLHRGSFQDFSQKKYPGKLMGWQ